MFSSIKVADEAVISGFQWLLRQIEIFTTVTRKQVLGAALLLFSVLQAYIVVRTWITFNILVLLIFVLPYGYVLTSQTMAGQLRELPGTMPRAIEERRRQRLATLFSCAVVYVILLVPVLYVGYASGTVAGWSLLGRMVPYLLLVLVAAIVEYLLCTSSLPPNERQKIRAEKEMGRFAPSAA